nr:hypothetical protein BACT7_18000 [Tenacibaculum mesophilum]
MKTFILFQKRLTSIVFLILINYYSFSQNEESLKSTILQHLNEGLIYQQNDVEQFFMFHPSYDEIISEFTVIPDWYFKDETIVFYSYKSKRASLFYLFDFKAIDSINVLYGKGLSEGKIIMSLHISEVTKRFFKVKSFIGNTEIPFKNNGKVNLFFEDNLANVLFVKNVIIGLAKEEGFHIKDLSE